MAFYLLFTKNTLLFTNHLHVQRPFTGGVGSPYPGGGHPTFPMMHVIYLPPQQVTYNGGSRN